MELDEPELRLLHPRAHHASVRSPPAAAANASSTAPNGTQRDFGDAGADGKLLTQGIQVSPRK